MRIIMSYLRAGSLLLLAVSFSSGCTSSPFERPVKEGPLERPVREWHPTEEELHRSYELWQGTLSGLPDEVTAKLKDLLFKPCSSKNQFIEMLAGKLNEDERKRYEAEIVYLAARYTVKYPMPVASKADSSWAWKEVFGKVIQDVYVAAPDPGWPDSSYKFGSDYDGIISGKDADTVALRFKKAGKYPVKIVFTESPDRPEIHMVCVGYRRIGGPLGSPKLYPE
jgi:hypothetical protein